MPIKILTMKMKKIKKYTLVCSILFSLTSFACNYQPLKENSAAAPSPIVEDKQAQFQSDLQTMKTANFEYIFVFRRKDGGEFDGEDRKYLRTNAPAETNRFVAADDGKAFIAGSKYKFPPENLEVLRMRFNIEDFSAIEKNEVNANIAK